MSSDQNMADAAPPAQHDAAPVASTGVPPLTNGDHEPTATIEPSANGIGSTESALLHKTDTSLDTSIIQHAEPGPSGPTPVDDVVSESAQVPEFPSKDRPASHPTPPPDETLADEKPTTDAEVSIANAPDPDSAQDAPVSDSRLVRPREDESDDPEPATKRLKITDDAGNHETENDLAMPDASQPDVTATAKPDQAESTLNDGVKAEDAADISVAETPAPVVSSEESLAAGQSADGDANTIKVISSALPDSAAPASEKPSYSKDPVTPAQKAFLLDKMKNLKKTRNSAAFLRPVDYVALNIPMYPEIIKKPMDLTTMESKLKSDQYGNVQEFADDFDLIITNTRRFNGDKHAVTSAGLSMEAYFRSVVMNKVPSTGEPIPQRPAKQSPAVQKPQPPRRESRSANVSNVIASAPPPSVTHDTFALQPDGTPQIRRESTNNRPARAIKPPQNREIAYGKPKRKENQPELKFCDSLLQQLASPKYAPQNSPFLVPVDPVALNIPNYHQVVKHPMDLQTMRRKLTNGEYAKASEFKKDFELILSNCNLFNPPGNPVRDLGAQLHRNFESLWAGKEKFVQKQRKAESQRAASASGDDESAEEEEEEEEEEVGDSSQTATILALQKQLADMQNALAGLGKTAVKPKKSKPSAKPSSKKAGGATAASKTKVASKPKAPKKQKQVTYDEKQEISQAVERLEEGQLEKLTHIITENCSKYADMDEMELEIDDLPNNVQLMLLEYVRSIFGNPNRHRAASPDDLAAMDDDDFEPEAGRGRGAGNGGGKRKKHKPMGKKEQQDTIKQIQSQLAAFNNPNAGSSESPAAAGHSAADQSSDDDSESEEE